MVLKIFLYYIEMSSLPGPGTGRGKGKGTGRPGPGWNIGSNAVNNHAAGASVAAGTAKNPKHHKGNKTRKAEARAKAAHNRRAKEERNRREAAEAAAAAAAAERIRRAAEEAEAAAEAAAAAAPAAAAAARRESARVSAAEALIRPTIRDASSSFKIAQKAMYTNVDTKFPTEWWEKRSVVDPTRKNPQEVLKIKQHGFNKYARDQKEKYTAFMTGLKSLPGYVRIVTQNMHCRDIGTPGPAYIACKAALSFEDNQTERATEFAKLINLGSINAHVIAVQELQHDGAREKFIETLDKSNYGVWLPDSGVYFGKGYGAVALAAVKATPGALATLGKTVYARPYASVATVAAGTLGAFFAPALLAATAAAATPFAAAAGGVGTVFAVHRKIHAGQGFVWDKRKVKIIQTEFLLFPKEITSGADAKGVGLADYSFKAVAFAQFQLLNTPKAKFSVFNIHPSPYVQSNDLEAYRSKYEIDMVASHLYQFTLTAKRIKDHLKSQHDYVFVCGDWNVNKYFQNGYSEKGAREDVKVDAVDAVPVVGRGFEEISKKNGAKTITAVEERETCFRDDIPFTNNNNCDFHASGGSEFMTVSEILGTIPPTHLYSISEHAADIPAPYGGKYTWDGLLNSVMFSPYWSSRAFQLLDHIVYSKYGKIPIYAHTMTKRYLTTVPVPATEGPLGQDCREHSTTFGGKQIKIPVNLKPYMRKSEYDAARPARTAKAVRGLRTRATALSLRATREAAEYALRAPSMKDKVARAAEVKVAAAEAEAEAAAAEAEAAEAEEEDNEELAYVHQYVDIADHYGVECVAILDTAPETIDRLANLASAFYTSAKFWVDPFLPTNVDDLCTIAAAGPSPDPNVAPAAAITDRDARAASRADGPAITFNKFQIPKLWELLSNTFDNEEFNNAKQKLTGRGCSESIKIIISKIVNIYIKYNDPAKMSYIPENINTAYIINQFVFKMANRLIEREYLNRIRFNHRFAAEIPFGKFVEKAANSSEAGCKKGNMLYSCKIKRKTRNIKNRQRGQLLNLADRGQINRFSRRAHRNLRSPNIINDVGWGTLVPGGYGVRAPVALYKTKAAYSATPSSSYSS
jgi:hypothetical protein